MRGLGWRILKSAGPAAVVLTIVGYLIAEMASSWSAANAPVNSTDAASLKGMLRGRVPFVMAAWGFGLVALYEVLRWVWMPRAKPKPVEAGPSVEDQLQQLLREAEARNPTVTPPPTGCPSPVGADNTAP